MANPVTNNPVTPKTAVGGAAESRKIATGAPVNHKAGNQAAIDNVNHNLAQDPNFAPGPANADGERAGNGNFRPGEAGPELDAEAVAGEFPARGKQGGDHGHARGHGNGRGHDGEKGDGGVRTPPIIVVPKGGDGKTDGPVRTPPIIPNNFPVNSPVDLPRGDGRGRGDDDRRADDNRGHGNNRGHDYGRTNGHDDRRGNGGRTNGPVRQILDTVLRRNDVYLTRAALERVMDGHGVTREVRALLDNITARVNGGQAHDQAKIVREIVKENGRHIQETVAAAKSAFARDGALSFRQLNPAERFRAAADLLPAHLPEKASQQILQHRSPDVANGLLLARGFANAAPPADSRAMAAVAADVLPATVSLTQLRDVGRLVQGLIADTTAAKSTMNLDLAVQKFVRLLLANNELGVLLATIDLAAGHANGAGAVGRSLALAQIYELIGRMIAAGEKTLGHDEKAVAGRNIFVNDGDAGQEPRSARTAAEAAASLRQFLEFNPNCHFDRSASAFLDQNDAKSAQRDFSSANANEIEAWLKSGNHRLVKEIELGREVGVVVDRDGDVYGATTARFVLVRDGSVQGWHFLRTMLVR